MEQVMKRTTSLWPWAIATLLGVVFAANFTLLFLAVKTDDGLTDEDYYVKGLFYNDRLQNEKRLGWRIEFSFDGTPRAGGPNGVRVYVRDKGGMVLEDARVRVVLRRPATDRYDRTFDLSPAGPYYSGEIAIPLEGFWDINVTVDRGGDGMEKTFRIKV